VIQVEYLGHETSLRRAIIVCRTLALKITPILLALSGLHCMGPFSLAYLVVEGLDWRIRANLCWNKAKLFLYTSNLPYLQSYKLFPWDLLMRNNKGIGKSIGCQNQKAGPSKIKQVRSCSKSQEVFVSASLDYVITQLST
jgi:hypothetical protein